MQITELDGHALSRAIHAREVSCVEVMRAYLARIDRLNPSVNAIVSLVPDDTLVAQAAERDSELARGAGRGWMHGMPQAIKDLANVAGLPIGLQFVGPMFGDALVLRAARAYEALHPIPRPNLQALM